VAAPSLPAAVYLGGLLSRHFPNRLLHFLGSIIIESLLVRRQLVQQPQELARMDALFVGDVLEYGDCAIVVGGLGLLLVQVPELRYCVSQSPHGSYLSIWNPL
jgi:hypothetical protein